MSFKRITTPAALFAAVDVGKTSESRSLEFKGEYRWRTEKHTAKERARQDEELCKDVAQFANGEGGTLLVGIGERVNAAGQRVADALQGVESVDGFRGWAEQAIRNHLAPSTFSYFMDPIALADNKVIVAINIPPSLHLVALWHQDRSRGIEYLYRTDHGKQWMNPDEVERHLMNGSRAMQIAINDVLEEVGSGNAGSLPVDLTPPLKPLVTLGSMGSRHYVQPSITLHRPGCTARIIELRVRLSDKLVSVYVPHGLIIDVWNSGNGHVGLCLKVAVVVQGEGQLGLEPVVAVV